MDDTLATSLMYVQRSPAVGTGVPGVLTLGDGWQCYTLERLSTLIPVGVYPVTLTVSSRATQGLLWSPDPSFRLPLITVPGRSGIRIHAANTPEQLEGCIAVGQMHVDDRLWQSRAALSALWQQLVNSPTSAFTIDITDNDPLP